MGQTFPNVDIVEWFGQGQIFYENLGFGCETPWVIKRKGNFNTPVNSDDSRTYNLIWVGCKWWNLETITSWIALKKLWKTYHNSNKLKPLI